MSQPTVTVQALIGCKCPVAGAVGTGNVDGKTDILVQAYDKEKKKKKKT